MSQKLTVITVCILSVLLIGVQTQSTFEKNRLSEIFSTESPKAAECGPNEECVPIYLCNENNSIDPYGVEVIDLRFGGGGCHYLEKCCKKENELEAPASLIMRPEGCGYRNPNGVGFRISGDKEGESQFGEFPWMVMLSYNQVTENGIFTRYVCGGSIIANDVVLTAAHSVKNFAPQDLMARAGEWDIQTKKEILPHQDARVKEIILHEQFDQEWLYNDIALLILETPFQWAGNVAPICLPAPGMSFDYSRCYATGWGKTKFSSDAKYQKILKKLELPSVPFDICEQKLRRTRLGPTFKLHRSFMCAGGEKDKDTCTGDGGSPLVCLYGSGDVERYYQAGIVSWGIGCGQANVPAALASVSYLRNWINDKLSARGILV